MRVECLHISVCADEVVASVPLYLIAGLVLIEQCKVKGASDVGISIGETDPLSKGCKSL